MKILLPIVFYLLYWGACWLGTGTDRKNLLGLRSYPDAVQAQVRAHMDAPKEKSMPAVLLSNLLLFTVVFSALGLIFRRALGLDTTVKLIQDGIEDLPPRAGAGQLS